MGFTIGMITGICLLIFGLLALVFPGLERFINFPGNARIKAIAVMVTGVIIMVTAYIWKW